MAMSKQQSEASAQKGLPVYASSTPGEVETVLLANGDKDISALKQEYEKVRYGK